MNRKKSDDDPASPQSGLFPLPGESETVILTDEQQTIGCFVAADTDLCFFLSQSPGVLDPVEEHVLNDRNA